MSLILKTMVRASLVTIIENIISVLIMFLFPHIVAISPSKGVELLLDNAAKGDLGNNPKRNEGEITLHDTSSKIQKDSDTSVVSPSNSSNTDRNNNSTSDHNIDPKLNSLEKYMSRYSFIHFAGAGSITGEDTTGAFPADELHALEPISMGDDRRERMPVGLSDYFVLVGPTAATGTMARMDESPGGMSTTGNSASNSTLSPHCDVAIWDRYTSVYRQ